MSSGEADPADLRPITRCIWGDSLDHSAEDSCPGRMTWPLGMEDDWSGSMPSASRPNRRRRLAIVTLRVSITHSALSIDPSPPSTEKFIGLIDISSMSPKPLLAAGFHWILPIPLASRPNPMMSWRLDRYWGFMPQGSKREDKTACISEKESRVSKHLMAGSGLPSVSRETSSQYCRNILLLTGREFP